MPQTLSSDRVINHVNAVPDKPIMLITLDIDLGGNMIDIIFVKFIITLLAGIKPKIKLAIDKNKSTAEQICRFI